MEKIIKVLAVFFLLSLLCCTYGCGGVFFALYGSEKQYDSGDHYWLAGSQEMARIKQDKLAIEKLKAAQIYAGEIDLSTGETRKISLAPAKTALAGYKGIIFNKSRHRGYNFVASGPETKGWYLGPGEIKEAYLLPGVYCYKRYYGSTVQDKPLIFYVSAQTHQFGSQKVHWYIGAEW